MPRWRPTLPPYKTFKEKELGKLAQTVGFIYQLGESPILRQPSKKIEVKQIKTVEFMSKLKYVKECLLKYRKLTGMGRGIAAVQVGIHEAFAVIFTKKKLVTIINPIVIKKSKKLLKYPEMCMSSAPLIAPVVRPEWIMFEYLDEKGDRQVWDSKDETVTGRMLNRVFQHEIDHLNGVISLDRIKSPNELLLHSDPDFYKYASFEEIESN